MPVPESREHDEYPTVVSDLALLCKSIQQGWAMPDHTRQQVIQRLTEVVENPNSTSREINRAKQALANLDRLRLQSVLASKSILEKAPPTVIIQQAAQDDPVRAMIENATPEQLVVIRDLLKAKKDEQPSLPDTGRESAAIP